MRRVPGDVFDEQIVKYFDPDAFQNLKTRKAQEDSDERNGCLANAQKIL